MRNFFLIVGTSTVAFLLCLVTVFANAGTSISVTPNAPYDVVTPDFASGSFRTTRWNWDTNYTLVVCKMGFTYRERDGTCLDKDKILALGQHQKCL